MTAERPPNRPRVLVHIALANYNRMNDFHHEATTMHAPIAVLATLLILATTACAGGTEPDCMPAVHHLQGGGSFVVYPAGCPLPPCPTTEGWHQEGSVCYHERTANTP